MAYGISVEADDGRIVVDDNHPVFVFKQKLTLSGGGTTAVKSQTITGVVGTPLVFAAPPSGTKASLLSMVDNGSGSFTFTWGVASDNGQSAYSGNVEFYVFETLDASSSVNTGYGMNVYDGSGTPIFTTNRRLLKLAGYHVTTAVAAVSGSGNLANLATQTITEGTVPASPAFANGYLATYLVGVGPFGRFFGAGCGRASSSQIRVGLVAFLGQGPSPGAGNVNTSGMVANHNIMIIDKTLYD